MYTMVPQCNAQRKCRSCWGTGHNSISNLNLVGKTTNFNGLNAIDQIPTVLTFECWKKEVISYVIQFYITCSSTNSLVDGTNTSLSFVPRTSFHSQGPALQGLHYNLQRILYSGPCGWRFHVASLGGTWPGPMDIDLATSFPPVLPPGIPSLDMVILLFVWPLTWGSPRPWNTLGSPRRSRNTWLQTLIRLFLIQSFRLYLIRTAFVFVCLCLDSI